MTFGSNFKKNKALIRIIILFLFSGIFVAAYQISNTNLLYLVNQKYFFDSTKIYAGYYKSENKTIDFLLTPEIESDIVHQKIVKLFIPVFDHERTLRKNICTTLKDDETLSKKENVLRKKKNLLNCYHQYHKVYLDEKPIILQYKKYHHPITDQFGILTYINLSDISEGEHTIRIKKEYDNLEQNVEWSIPFQYSIRN